MRNNEYYSELLSKPAKKDPLEANLEEKIAEFLRKGGTIEQVPYGKTAIKDLEIFSCVKKGKEKFDL